MGVPPILAVDPVVAVEPVEADEPVVAVEPVETDEEAETVEPVASVDPVDTAEELDLFRCDDVGTFPVGFNPTAGVACRLDLVDTAEVILVGSGGDRQVLALETDPVPFQNMIDVPLEYKRLFESYFCNCDNSFTDRLADADEIGEIFFTATLRDLNQIGSLENFDDDFNTYNIEGTWTDDFRNTVPLFSAVGSTFASLTYLPPPGFVRPLNPFLRFESNALGDIFISQFSSSSTGDDTTIVSQCVVQ